MESIEQWAYQGIQAVRSQFYHLRGQQYKLTDKTI